MQSNHCSEAINAIKAMEVAIEMKWSVVRAFGPTRDRVPASSGVYCFMKSEVIADLKTGTKPLYVGKSKNIRTRLRQHLNNNHCHNHGLLIDLIQQSKSNLIEFYYMEAHVSNLDALERELISQLNPSHNILLTGV